MAVKFNVTPCKHGAVGKRRRIGHCFCDGCVADRRPTRLAAKKRNYEANKQKLKEASRAYKATPAGHAVMIASCNKRKTAARQQLPSWANLDAIKAVYVEARRLTELTGVAHHVDHIIPLNGKRISGLHVENNLQILEARDNLVKSNKWDIE